MSETLQTTLIVLAINLAWYLISIGFDTFFKGKINFGFSRKLAKEKELYDARIKAEVVAELLAEWQSFPEDTTKLKALSYKAFLWLPKEQAEDLTKILTLDPQAKSIRNYLGDIRNLILKNEETMPNHLIVDFDLGNDAKVRKEKYRVKKILQKPFPDIPKK